MAADDRRPGRPPRASGCGGMATSSTAMSYNAAEGKDVAPLTDAPPISLDQLTEIANSDVWFSWELAQ